jgi:hypothetical protein
MKHLVPYWQDFVAGHADEILAIGVRSTHHMAIIFTSSRSPLVLVM